ncbi:hypothetical protein C0Q70_18414 [Pomacea canaliculata]|uniref:Uncharacterized protein n=1 Tax=Pomacea canaliculata TaxID=400727 RepID=A0A2T7NN65_POMCA|nr:hypothetical protein C0Q70_18414 [Pomacea canaliculata]
MPYPMKGPADARTAAGDRATSAPGKDAGGLGGVNRRTTGRLRSALSCMTVSHPVSTGTAVVMYEKKLKQSENLKERGKLQTAGKNKEVSSPLISTSVVS